MEEPPRLFVARAAEGVPRSVREPLHETVTLTAEELQSLRRVCLGLDRMALPAAHNDNLLDGGYVREGPE